MKYNFLLNFFFILLTLFLSNFVFSQDLTPESLRNLKVNDLSDEKVKKIKDEMDKKSLTISSLETIALSNGMSPNDFNLLKLRLESIAPASTETNLELGTNITEKPIKLDASSSIPKSDIYGSQIFNNPALSFEPNSNLVTPSSYILGPGDEILIVIYGMQEFSANPSVNKEGKINLPIVGQIHVSGLSIDAAKSLIKKVSSRIYTTLGTGQSNLSVTITKYRTIMVTMIGTINPGNYSVSSLSTVFNALHISGGPDLNGSYRNIELIRNNVVFKKIDIYKFLTSGDLSANLNLMENDVIRVPVYENRIKIDGQVRTPGVFELLPNENFNDLLKYCSGFTESAYKTNIKLIQNTEKELRIRDLSENEYKEYKPKSGDVFKVSTILNKYENKISIKGAVFRPDDYALVEGMTVKDLIIKADGLTNDAYLNKAQLIREKEDLSKEFISLNLKAIIDGNEIVKLKKNDEIIISSIFDFKNTQIVTIGGQIKNDGDYPFIENLTLYDLIIQAGGFSEMASKNVEISSLISKDELKDDKTLISVVKNIQIDTLLKDQTKNVKLNPFDVVQVRKRPIYESQSMVKIMGEVQYPGSYVLINSNEKFLDVINRSGNITSLANKDAIYILRSVDKLVTDKIEKIQRKIPVDYSKIVKRPNSLKNVILKPGDEIIVTKIDDNVKISGNVYLNSEIPFVRGKSFKYYINSVGGFNEKTDKKRIYVVQPNGLAKSTKSFLFFRNYPRVNRGCEIVVPVKTIENENNKLSITELSIITGVIGSLSGMTIAIINLLTN